MGHNFNMFSGYCMKCGVHYYQADIAPDCATVRLSQRSASALLAKQFRARTPQPTNSKELGANNG